MKEENTADPLVEQVGKGRARAAENGGISRSIPNGKTVTTE